jgi:signal transduction histidine kinase/DNA-binding response OmpR family regulator/PAS domain-containing protein
MSVIHEIIKKITSNRRITEKPEEKELRKVSERCAVIADALNESLEIFSAHKEKTFDEVMTNGIRPVAEAVGVDRIVFYTVVDREKKRLGQIYRWDKSEGGLMFLAEELLILPNIPVIENWILIALQGGSVRLKESDYSEDEAAFLCKYGIKSILMLPVFSYGEFWGIISFQNHAVSRYFDEGCAGLLNSAMRIFTNAIIREEMNHTQEKNIETLKNHEKTVDTLNKVAIMFLSQSKDSFEDTMTAGVKEIVNTFDLDRFSVWRNFNMPDGLHGGQIYRWDKEMGGSTLPTQGLEDLSYAKNVPRWEKIFSEGGTINSPVRILPEAYMFQSFSTKSVFIVPMFFNNDFWGLVFFEDHHNERFFSEDSADLLRSAAFLCANTIIRADMERKIINANEFTRAVLDASPLNFTVFDENANMIDCNDATLEVFGTTREYYLENFSEFSPEYQSDGVKSSEKAAEVVRRTLDGEKQVFEWLHRSLSGEFIPFEVTLTRTMYNGKYMALGYQYDLRNIKKMENSIREQSEQLKIKLEQQELLTEISRGFISSGSTEMLVKEAITKLGRYHKVSLIFIFAMNYQQNNIYPAYHWNADGTTPRLINLNLFKFIEAAFPKTLPDCATMPIIACEDTAARQDQVYQALADIDIRAIIVTPLYVEGRLWGILSVEHCSTPRQWTEGEKSFVSMIASTIAGVIMRDIYNSRLKKALHKATEASKAKGEFLSNMSHEMRTPLNAITGMTTIGRNTKDIERKDYALSKIEDASTHLLGVINDVLDMSKIEANMLELSPIEFNFEKMLQKVVAVVNFRIDEKQQKLTVHIDRKIPKLLVADDQRLAQVITNLLGNAVKFTPENGSIILEARFEGEEDELCTIQVSVIDTGIGISGEHQKRLFSSFQQAESSTTRRYGGTGLGLAISKSIVEMMGGKIWVNSEYGKGATFAFTVRAKRGTEEKQGLHTSGVNLSNVRILAVDDDPDILVYFRDVTKVLGVFCETAKSGEEALRLVDQKGSYHIYFVDWKMPGMDGIQLSHELKIRTSKNSVVIMISAAEWSVVADEAKKAGVDKFLSKPLFPSTIEEVINECIGADKHQEKEINTNINGLFAGHRILLVEDVEINREVVMTLLEPTQLEIDCAENGIEAVRMFTEAPDRYELIFMDIQMPEMDGYDATRNIRALEIQSAKNIPIIAMTANVFKEDIEKCIEAGMDSHIGKPLDFDEVMEKLYAHLSMKNS